MRAGLTDVFRDPSEDTNTLLLGELDAGPGARLRAASLTVPPSCADSRGRRGPACARAARRPRLHRRPAPVEWLIDRSILGYAAGE